MNVTSKLSAKILPFQQIQRHSEIDTSQSPNWGRALIFGAILIFALWIRFPQVSFGLPYLYDEDEAHHFDRTVEMIQRGSLDPQYFLKPALHFYLRIPVTIIAFFKSVEAGEARELKDITIKNPYGVAGWSFTASHPRLIKYNRAFTLLLSLGVLFLIFRIGGELGSPTLGLTAALIAGVLPLHVSLSTHIGVDMLTCLLTSLTALLTLSAFNRRSLVLLAFAALSAGLAVAAKYNAAPVVALPLIGVLFVYFSPEYSRHQTDTRQSSTSFIPMVGLVALLTISGFLLGAPYSLIHLTEFVNGAAFEIHHYKYLNAIEPGFPQATYYLSWLGSAGIGWAVLLLTGIGALQIFTTKELLGRGSLLFLFPILYFIYMCSQRVNYTRNMLPLIPFIALAAAYAILNLRRLIAGYFTSKQTTAVIVTTLLIFVSTAQPSYQTFADRREIINFADSRVSIADYLATEKSALIAIPGEFQLPATIRSQENIDEIRFKKFASGKRGLNWFWEEGFDQLLMPNFSLAGSENLPVIRTFPGELVDHKLRILKNPGAKMVSVGAEITDWALPLTRAETLRDINDVVPLGKAKEIKASDTHGYLRGFGEVETVANANPKRWIQGRYGALALKPFPISTLTVRTTSAAPDQQLSIYLNGKPLGTQPVQLGKFSELSFTVTEGQLKGNDGKPVLLELVTSQVVRPTIGGTSTDNRPLSIAVEWIRFN